MNQTSFKKGSIGQKCVEKLFAGKRVLYWTDENCSHPFDGMALNWEDYDIIAIEIKAKAARTHYKDTGYNLSQHDRLHKARDKFGKDPLIVFVDEGIGKIYGNYLSILERERIFEAPVSVQEEWIVFYPHYRERYPSIEGGIIYFPLLAMKYLGEIEEGDLIRLRELSCRNDNFEYPSEDWYDDLGQDAI